MLGALAGAPFRQHHLPSNNVHFMPFCICETIGDGCSCTPDAPSSQHIDHARVVGSCVIVDRMRLAGLITCFKVQEAGRFAASGDCQGVLKLWSLASGVQLDVRDDAHPAGCSSVAFLEPHVVSCSQSLAFHAHVAPQ